MSSKENLRQRKEVQNANGSATSSNKAIDLKREDATTFGVLDLLRIIGGVLLLNCLLSYFITNDSLLWGWRPWFIRPNQLRHYLRGPIYLTDAELLEFNGSDPAKPIYLALNGTIYDVSTNPRMYGPGASYSVFAGKDAARAYVTGCFAEDGVPDLRGAEWTYVPIDVPGFDEPATAAQKSYREQELRKAKKAVHATIAHWQRLFAGETGKDYFEVGKVRRSDGWLEQMPLRKLCDAAQQGRPKPNQQAKDAGAKYRGGR